VELLTAHNNAGLLIEQALKHKPNAVVLTNSGNGKYNEVKNALSGEYIKVFEGINSVSELVQGEEIDQVITAMVGFAGLLPTIKAIEAGKDIALANKETLVVAGELIQKAAADKNIQVIPVDSEHSAIFQCLTGEAGNEIEKIYLTASGGPFRQTPLSELPSVSPEQALDHPNWDMGAKITIDSATMFNKGLEAIEAKWLFGLNPDQIEVIVHPQSIIHSIVQFTDGSMKAQMSLPDMRMPIQYALSYPERQYADFERLSFDQVSRLDFHRPDMHKFRNLALCYQAMERGHNIPCALNAANEVAVPAFLEKKIRFTEIPEIIEQTTTNIKLIKNPTLQDYLDTDQQARQIAGERVQKKEK
jgi:1-deoxy-D-xylulose-5-phosphate reductoisomerase